VLLFEHVELNIENGVILKASNKKDFTISIENLNAFISVDFARFEFQILFLFQDRSTVYFVLFIFGC
jgi:hypothetical protein